MNVHTMKTNTMSLEAEQVVLGSLMLKGGMYDEVAQIISAEDFSQHHHAEIYRAIETMAKRGEPREPRLVEQELIRRGVNEQCGGELYLIDLAQSVAAYSSAPAYARVVEEHSKRRKVIAECGVVVEQARAGADMAEVLEDLGKLTSSLATKSTSSAAKFCDIADDFTNMVTDAQDGKLACFKTGFRILDIAIGGGLFPGELIIVAGRPGSGKTTFAMNVAMHIAKTNPVYFFSMEMPKESLFAKAVSNYANVPLSKFRRGDLTEEEHSRVTPATSKARKLKLTVNEGSGLSAQQMLAKGREFKRENPDAGLIVVDYLQLMEAKGDTRAIALGEITRAAKIMARELELPVILLSQFNRELEKREVRIPRMSDLRDSGSIEQDADVICGMHRPHSFDEMKPPNEAFAYLIKNRNGEPDKVPLNFVGQYSRFEDYRR